MIFNTTLRAFCLSALWLVLGGANVVFAQTNFAFGELSGSGIALPVLFREAVAQPARYRVIFIPGSGCAGMKPISDHYFRGLLHADVLVLHKPGIDLMAGPAPKNCTSEFVRWDALSRWSVAARIALQNDSLSHSHLPQILVGASEGAEILPSLSGVVANLRAIVIISSSGLNPRDTAELQALRLGAKPAWQDLGAAVASSAHDDSIFHSRTLKYWRDLWSWSVSTPLLASALPVIQVWGSEDDLIPVAAYERFENLAGEAGAISSGHVCIRRLEGADHGLQSSKLDGVQWLWAQLERWARNPGDSPCTVFNSTLIKPTNLLANSTL